MGIINYSISKGISNNILISGASSYLGSFLIKHYIDTNCKLTLLANSNTKRLQKMYKDNDNIQVISTDIRQLDNFKKQMKKICKRESFDKVYHLANPSPVNSNFQELIDVNITGFNILAELIVPNMLKMGRGVFIAMGSSYFFNPPIKVELLNYSIAKAGLMTAARYWGNKFSSDNIQFLCFTPGPINSPLNKTQDIENLIPPKALIDRMIAIEEFHSNSDVIDIYFKNGGIHHRSFGTEKSISIDRAEETQAGGKKVFSEGSASVGVELISLIKNVFSSTSDYSNDKIMSLGLDDCDDWDSLGHLRLIMEVEAHFGVSVKSTQVADLVSVNAILNHLNSQIEK